MEEVTSVEEDTSEEDTEEEDTSEEDTEEEDTEEEDTEEEDTVEEAPLEEDTEEEDTVEADTQETLPKFVMRTVFESCLASGFMEWSRSGECELVADESAARLRRQFGRESKDRRRSGSVTAFARLTPARPRHNRSAADRAFTGWPAREGAEHMETSEEGFGNRQGTETRSRPVASDITPVEDEEFETGWIGFTGC